MPRRAITNITDVPVDVLCELISSPESFQPRIDEWRQAKAEARDAEAAAGERETAAGERETAVQQREDAVAQRETEVIQTETRLEKLGSDLAAREVAVADRERAAAAREDTLASRGQKAIYWGKFKPFEHLLLRTPIVPWSYLASRIFHDFFWYQVFGKTIVKKFLRTGWGKLFQKYG